MVKYIYDFFISIYPRTLAVSIDYCYKLYMKQLNISNVSFYRNQTNYEDYIIQPNLNDDFFEEELQNTLHNYIFILQQNYDIQYQQTGLTRATYINILVYLYAYKFIRLFS